MTNIIRFPGAARPESANQGIGSEEVPVAKDAPAGRFFPVLRRVYDIVMIPVAVLVFFKPFSILLNMFIVWQFCSMLWHWNDPAVSAGWQFIGWFLLVGMMHWLFILFPPSWDKDM